MSMTSVSGAVARGALRQSDHSQMPGWRSNPSLRPGAPGRPQPGSSWCVVSGWFSTGPGRSAAAHLGRSRPVQAAPGNAESRAPVSRDAPTGLDNATAAQPRIVIAALPYLRGSLASVDSESILDVSAPEGRSKADHRIHERWSGRHKGLAKRHSAANSRIAKPEVEVMPR